MEKQRDILTVYNSDVTDPSKLICSTLTATHPSLTALLFTLCRRLRPTMSTFRTMMTTLPGAGSFRDIIPAVEAFGEGTQGGARVHTGPDGDAGGSGRGRARRGRRVGRHGDGRGDADRRQTANPTLPDGTEVLWQPDNGMQPDWLQDLAGATSKLTLDATDVRPVDYFQAHSRLSFSNVCALRLTGTMLSGYRILMRVSRSRKHSQMLMLPRRKF